MFFSEKEENNNLSSKHWKMQLYRDNENVKKENEDLKLLYINKPFINK